MGDNTLHPSKHAFSCKATVTSPQQVLEHANDADYECMHCDKGVGEHLTMVDCTTGVRRILPLRKTSKK